MTPRRAPTFPPDLADTLDEQDQARAELDAAYFDTPRLSPEERDLEARVAALELGAKRKTLIRKWAERALSFLAGSSMAILVWALTKAEQRGDDKAEARRRTDEHAWLMTTVRAMQIDRAEIKGQIDAIVDRLRYPMQGPPTAPRTDP